jgi:hypothetical protein
VNALTTLALIISGMSLIIAVVSIRLAYRNKQVTMFVPKTDGKYVCTHDDPLCKQYGCPDDPGWIGDRR